MVTREYLQERLDYYTQLNEQGELVCKPSYNPETQTRILSKSIKLKIISYYLATGNWAYNVYSTSPTINSVDPNFLKAETITND